MRKMCKDCLHFDHCVNIPNYPVTNNTIGCDDWECKDKYVPVVRCEDCKRCTETEHGLACDHALPTKRLEQYLCFGTDILALVKPDDFCSYGERKDGEG